MSTMWCQESGSFDCHPLPCLSQGQALRKQESRGAGDVDTRFHGYDEGYFHGNDSRGRVLPIIQRPYARGEVISAAAQAPLRCRISSMACCIPMALDPAA